MNEALRQELLALAEQEQRFGSRSQVDNRDSEEAQRQLLEPMGWITQGLVDILDTYGWPGKSLAGEDGAEAAWTLALHTMHDPDVLRRCLALLEDAAVAGEAEPWQVAFLVDRVALVERNIQVYTTTICGKRMGGLARRCRKIQNTSMSAAGLSAFLRWNTTSAGSKRTTAASASSSVRSLTAGTSWSGRATWRTGHHRARPAPLVPVP